MRKSLPIFYSALLLTAVNLLLRFVSTSFQVHISSRIGAEGVGLLQLVLSVGALAITAGMAGIRTATMYLTADALGRKQQENISRILRFCLLYSILFSGGVSLCLYGFAPWIAHRWIGNPNTLDAIRLYCCFLPIICLTGCMTGYYTAENRISTLALIEIGEQLFYMTVTMLILNLWSHQDPERACKAVILGSGISAAFTLLMLVLFKNRSYGKAKGQPQIIKKLLSTALPLAAADNIKAGISTAENLMVPKRLALFVGEISPLATFGVVTGMVFPVLMFPAAILFALAELLIPELAKCAAAENRARIRYLVTKGLRVSAIYGCICGGILYLIAEPLCDGLYRNPDAGKFLKLYSLLTPMLYCDAITDAMTKGLGQQTYCVKYNIITSAMDVALLYILLPTLGMKGYFFSFLVTHLLNFMLSIRRLFKITGLRLPFYLPASLISITVISAFAATGFSSVITRIASFLLMLGALLAILGIVRKRDIAWLKGIVYRKTRQANARRVTGHNAFNTSKTNA